VAFQDPILLQRYAFLSMLTSALTFVAA
jgi:hypothetical protein